MSDQTIHRRRCQVKRACSQMLAAWWYYPDGERLVFIPISRPKPSRYAAPCCQMCRVKMLGETML